MNPTASRFTIRVEETHLVVSKQLFLVAPALSVASSVALLPGLALSAFTLTEAMLPSGIAA